MSDPPAPQPPAEIVLRLRPLRDPRPVGLRLRYLLKHLLRAGSFRCVRVEGLPPEPGEKGEVS